MVVETLVASGQQWFAENKMMVMIFKPTNLLLQASCEFLASIFKYGSSNGFQWVKRGCNKGQEREMAERLVRVPLGIHHPVERIDEELDGKRFLMHLRG
ncbi:hypothetical protein E3N88_00116 [Mikania micrantha]|uniref:Uncharacterized protein n=1 Tax=Mikania micrantha TaxID=192012 RepID=A0A5N6PZX4_9ASTR|nr:hypothetical protein E3N88_00116 [Mikania micrantha]